MVLPLGKAQEPSNAFSKAVQMYSRGSRDIRFALCMEMHT